MPNSRPIPEADRVRAMKLFLMRRTAQLFSHVTDPDFTGYMLVEVHSKAGRPMPPKTGEMRTGVFEISAV